MLQFLLEPYEYLTQRTGKKIRTKLMEVPIKLKKTMKSK